MEQNQIPDDIHERLTELERVNKHVLRVNLAWRGAGLIAFIGCTILVLAQVREGRRTKYLDAENLIIRDGNGRERIALDATSSNGDVSFFDGKGRRRMIVALFREEDPPGSETPGITLFDEKGEKRMMLRVGASGASISVRDTAGVVHEIPVSAPQNPPDARIPSGQEEPKKSR